MPLRLLLTQHLFAAAARLLLQRGANRQSGRSLVPISPEPKPHVRCNLDRPTRRGTRGEFAPFAQEAAFVRFADLPWIAHKLHISIGHNLSSEGQSGRSSISREAFDSRSMANSHLRKRCRVSSIGKDND